MNPLDPNALPGDPNDGQPKPWQKQPPPPADDGGSSAANAGNGVGDAIDAGVQGAGLVGDVIRGAGDLAAGAIEGAGEVAGAAIEGAGSALEVASGCADGCSGCSLALLVTLFAAAGTAMAIFR